MHQNSAKFMPCLLSEEQKKNHVTCEFSGYKQNVIPHPPYSPDLVPWDLFLYPKLKMVLKGRNFNDITKIQAKLFRGNNCQDAKSELQSAWLYSMISGFTV